MKKSGNKKKEIVYSGVFFDEFIKKLLIEKQGKKFEKNIEDMHCTFIFRPTEEYNEKFISEFIGKDVKMKVVGYGCDNENSGFMVELPDEFRSIYKNIGFNGKLTTPHITVSMSASGKAVNTGKLNFSPIEPFEISGKLGMFVSENKNGKMTKYVDYTGSDFSKSENERMM